MASRVFLLLPPSEGKAIGGTRSRRHNDFADQLGEARERVRDALAKSLTQLDNGKLSKLLKVRGPLLERAIDANSRYVEGTELLMPTSRRYNGIVWGHLDPATLSPSSRRRLLVPSGLYGLTSGRCDIGDYRLAMNASLVDCGVLTRIWRQPLTETLREHCDSAIVVDLLTKEHAAAIDFEVLAQRSKLIRVAFVSGDDTRAVGHDAKAVKGVFARAIMSEGISVASDFRWAGWRARRDGDVVSIQAPR